MNSDTADEAEVGRTGRSAALAGLFASSTTLVCCALPALLVALGAGAALSSLVSALPQLVWVSENKILVFAVAGALLVIAGAAQWRNRSAPCSVDPMKRNTCLRVRKVSRRVFLSSVALYALGGYFAFVAGGTVA